MRINNFKTDLVSVVVPIYNQVGYVDETIASIVGQSYKNLEILLCDDSSNDGTKEKLLEWAGKDGRIIPILSDKNEGLSFNINKGLDRATGEFLAIMGGDDKMAPDKIGKQVYFLKNNPDFDVALHWVEVFDSKTGKILSVINSHILKSPADWFFPKVSFGFSNKSKNSTFPPTAYLARSVYALHSRYDYRLKFKNEVLFAIDNYMNKPNAKWHCIPEVLGFYRSHDNNMHKSREMSEALLEETYVNFAIASARYPSLKSKLKRILRYFLYMEVYYLRAQEKQQNKLKMRLAKSRLRAEWGLFGYCLAMIIIETKLVYLKTRH